jgi:RHS repeat-associated protein
MGGWIVGGWAGMATYNADPSRINLELSDTPAGYTPPVGPAVRFQVCYSQQEVVPASDPTYNLGPQWSCNWIAYVYDDTGNEYTKTYGPNGGELSYGSYTSTGPESGAFAVQPESHAILARTSGSTYQMTFPDGSVQMYGISDHGSPQKIYMSQSIDSASNALTYTYDSTYRLVAVTDAIGQVSTVSYVSNTSTNSGYNLIQQVTDPFGRSATFSYTSGQLVSITDVLGITSSFAYSGTSDFISSLTTPYGTTVFTKGGSGVDLTLQMTDPLGGTESLQYDDEDNPTDSLSPPTPSGMSTYTGYDNTRNSYYWSKQAYALAPGVKAQAHLFHWLHDSSEVGSDTLESEKPALEDRIFYNYPVQTYAYMEGSINRPSAVGRVLDDGSSQVYQYAYNAEGKTTLAEDPLGRTTVYQYASNGIDLVDVYQINTSGSSTVSGTAADLVASYTYNSQHCVLTATDASGQATAFTYNTAGQLVTVTNALMQTASNSYDSSGYLTRITGPEVSGTSASTSFTYDSYGRVQTVTDSLGYTGSMNYDAADRLTQVTYPDGTTSQISYNRLDPEYITDRLGRVTHLEHDALRHTVMVDDPLHRVTQYQWCTCGALAAIIDAAGNQTSFMRDAESRVTDKVFSDGSVTALAYENSTSRLASVTDALEQTTNYSYNTDDTLSGVSYSNAQVSTPSVSFSYDPYYNRIAGFADATTGSTGYSYNSITSGTALGQGLLGSVTGPLANSTITYSYDALGRVTGRSIYGGANASTASFDSMGRLTGIVNPLSTGTFEYGYLGATGLTTGITYPNGQQANFSYYGNTGDERLEEIQNLGPSANVISQFNYGYDADGEITSWQQANSALSGTNSFGLNYDAASQMSWATLIGSSGTTSYSYAYDKAGNRTQEQIDSATTTSGYNELNQLISQSAGGITHFRGTLDKWATVTVGGNAAAVSGTASPYLFDGTANLTTGTNTVVIAATDVSGSATAINTYRVVVTGGTGSSLNYDADGEMTSNGAGQSYQWDAANRLAVIWYGAIGSGSSTTFTYNALGQWVELVEKDASGTTTSTKKFVWDPGDLQPSEERDASDNVTKRFYPQGEQISGTNYSYTRDHLGSVRELTVTSGSGNVLTRYNYDLWGRQTTVSGTGTIASDFGYAGYYQHLPSGLNLTMFRAYNPNLGRWISRDPLGEAGGTNLYDYVANNPISRIDPLGLWQISIYAGAGWGGLISFGNNGGSNPFNGQWNVTAEVGGGFGASASLDWSSHCKKSGNGFVGTVAASAGEGYLGGGIQGDADSNQGADLTGNVRGGPWSGSHDFVSGQTSYTGAANYGASLFVGGGVSWAQ